MKTVSPPLYYIKFAFYIIIEIKKRRGKTNFPHAECTAYLLVSPRNIGIRSGSAWYFEVGSSSTGLRRAPLANFSHKSCRFIKKIKFAPQLYPADGALYIAAPVLAGVSFSVFLWRQSAAIPSAEALITAGSFSCADSALSDHRKTACSCTHRQQLRCGCTGIHVRRDAVFVPFRSFGTDARCLFHHRVHSTLQSAWHFIPSRFLK